MISIQRVMVTVVKGENGLPVLVVRCPFCGQSHKHVCDVPAPVVAVPNDSQGGAK